MRNDRLFHAEDAATNAAKGLAASVGSTFAEAEGMVVGDPSLKAGTTVSVSGVGNPFDGKYVLTSTRHILDRYGYRTQFVVSGRQDRTTIGLVSSGGAASPSGVGHLVVGAVPAVVTEVKDDPESLNRVKVEFPWLDDSFSSDWARVVMLGVGKDRGFAFLPEIDDEVLVCFEQGDFRRPYVLGGLYNGTDTPKDAGSLVDSASGAIAVRAITTVGHQLKFTDADSGKGIKLRRAASKGVAPARRRGPLDHDRVVGEHQDQGRRLRHGQHQGRHVDDARSDVEPGAESADREGERRRTDRDQVGRPAVVAGDADDGQGRRDGEPRVERRPAGAGQPREDQLGRTNATGSELWRHHRPRRRDRRPGRTELAIGGMPASVVGDMHTCPMVDPATLVPHVGGPVLPPGMPTVLISGRPAAVLGGMCTCVGPPDSIVLGAMNVLIGG